MSKGVTRAEVKAAVLDFSESMGHRIPLNYKIRDTWKQLYGFDSVCGGPLHSAVSENDPKLGFVTIAAGNHKSIEAVNRTLQHEILGHYMINTYEPVDKRAVLDTIINSQNDPSLAEHWNKVKRSYPDKSVSIQAEEVYANIAQDIDLKHSPRLNSDPLFNKHDALSVIETSIHHRANLLKQGYLEQKTFPSNDVHSALDLSNANLNRKAVEWRSDQPAQAVSRPSPSPGA